MSSEMLVAKYAIRISDPDLEQVATGRWNVDGTPIMCRPCRTIQPGEVFPAAWLGEHLAQILANGSAFPAPPEGV